MAASTLPSQTDSDVLTFTTGLLPCGAMSSAKGRRTPPTLTTHLVSDDDSSSPMRVVSSDALIMPTAASSSQQSGTTRGAHSPSASAVSPTPSSTPVVNDLPPSSQEKRMPHLFTMAEEEVKAMPLASALSEPKSEALSPPPSSTPPDGAAIPPAPAGVPASGPTSPLSASLKNSAVAPAHSALSAPPLPSGHGRTLPMSTPLPPPPKPDPLPPFRELYAKSAGECIRHEGLTSARLEQALLELPLEEQADAALDAVESQAARLIAWRTWRIEIAIGRERSGEASSVRLRTLSEADMECIDAMIKARDRDVDALLKLRERRQKAAHLESVNRRGDHALRSMPDAVTSVKDKRLSEPKFSSKNKAGKVDAVDE